MARHARERAESGVYHILIKGNNKLLFVEEADRRFFLELIAAVCEKHLLELYAYCLQDESLHIVLKEGLVNISQSIRNILSSYAAFYNEKYAREGKLFADRFKSEPIEGDEQLLECVKFVHRLKANCNSFEKYLKKSRDINFEIVLLLLDNSVVQFKAFMETPINGVFLGADKPHKLSDQDLKSKIKEMLSGVEKEELEGLDEKIELKILRKIKNIPGAGETQIARVLGIPKSQVEKA